MDQANQEKGIFINGKKQIIEMLRIMDDADKRKLLKNISLRNSAMARELAEQSYSFKDLMRLKDQELVIVLNYNNPTIVGLALYLLPQDFQRRSLTIMNRENAEIAYSVMSQNLTNKKVECEKALQKLVNSCIELSRKSLVSFS